MRTCGFPLPLVVLVLFTGACAGSPQTIPLADAGVCPTPCGPLCCAEREECRDGWCVRHCERPCGSDCCEGDETCHQGQCVGCVPDCAGRECGSDGCGGSCGECEGTLVCNPKTGQCECAPEAETAFCARNEFECGVVTGIDNCGDEREFFCGACDESETCDESHQCVCQGEADGVLCDREHYQCDVAELTDRCGVARRVDCGTCTGTDECVERQCLPCAQESEEEICRRHAVACGPLEALDRCQAMRTIEECGPCAESRLCDNGQCFEPSGNDSCATSRLLVFDENGRAAAIGDTTGARDDAATVACLGGSGRDVVFHFELSEPSHLDVTLLFTPAQNATVDQVVSVRQLCEDNATELGCRALRTPVDDKPNPVLLSLRYLAPGTYYLWVDTYSTSCSGSNNRGPFALEVQRSPVQPPAENDLCEGAKPLPFVGGLATVMGSTGEALNDDTCGLQPANGADLVYALTLTDPASVELVLSRALEDTWYKPALYVRDGCGAGAKELACVSFSTAKPAPTSFFPQLASGTYYVFVDGLSQTHGAFTLTARLGEVIPAPANDLCSGAQALPADGTFASVAGDTTGAGNEDTGTCATMDGAEVFYTFTLQSDALVLMRLARDETSPTFDPGLFLRKECGETTDLACSVQPADGPFLSRPLGAGTYVVGVDGRNGSRGSFTLEFWAGPAPANESCLTAQELSFENGKARVLSTLELAQNDIEASASGCLSVNGPDLVWTFTLPEAKALAARLDKLVRGTVNLLLKPESCVDTLNVIQCHAGQNDEPAMISVPLLEPGTYFLVADTSAYANERPPFWLEVELSEVQRPESDSCPGIPLAYNPNGKVSLFGDTTLARNDTGSLGCASADRDFRGGDIVYSFSLTEERLFSATVVRDTAKTPDYNPALYLRTACDDMLSEIACVNSTEQSGVRSATLTVKRLPPGDYYLFVDGWWYWGNPTKRTQSGAYTLDVTMGPPHFENDNCETAQPLDMRSNPTTAPGDNTYADFSTESYCGGNSKTLKDLVYSFTLQEPKAITVKVKPDEGSAIRPAVFVRAVCDVPKTQALCRTAPAAGQEAVLPYPFLPAGTYYIWVVGHGNTVGSFTVELATADVAGTTPRNDTCDNAETLHLPEYGTVTLPGDTTFAVNDYWGVCQSHQTNFPHSGGDVVYTFTIDKPINFWAKAVPANPDYRAVVYLRSACADDSKEASVLCAVGNGTTESALTIKTTWLIPGTYWLIVDGVATGTAGSTVVNYGAYELQIETAEVVPNDNCHNPEVLNFVGGVALASGDTTRAGNDASAVTNSCPGSSPPTGASTNDVVYSFELTEDAKVTIEAWSTTGTIRPLVYVRTFCDTQSSQLPGGCAVCSGSTCEAFVKATLEFPRLLPGVYYIWIDSTSFVAPNEKGPFALSVTATPVPVPAGDTCSAALPMPGFLEGRSVVSGTTSGAADHYTGTCGTANGPDLVYSFYLEGDSKVTAKVTATGTTTWTPAVYVRSADCENGAAEAELACNSSASATAANSWLGRGSYFVFVDGLSGSHGEFQLEVAIEAAVYNDTCARPTLLSFQGDTATIWGDTSIAVYDSADGAGCSAAGGDVSKDLVYQFTITQEQKVTVKLIPIQGMTLKPVVYLRSACDQAQTEPAFACAESSKVEPVEFTVPALGAGTYFVWVDGYGSSSGSPSEGQFELQVKLDTPPANPEGDRCDLNPIRLTFNENGRMAAPVSGDTTLARDDSHGSCQNPSAGDVVYWFVTGEPKRLTATLQRSATSSIGPALYLRANCERNDASSEAGCRQGGSTAESTELVVNSLPAGTWFLWVDSSPRGYGPYQLDVKLDPPVAPVPPNSSCMSPELLVFQDDQATVTGTTVNGGNNMSCTGPGNSGEDVVYQFVLDKPQKLDVEVQPINVPTMKSVLRLQSQCACADGSIASANDRDGGQKLTMSRKLLDPGTYFLWVDSNSGPGPFNLSVRRSVPNDACDVPVELTAGQPMPGTTVGAKDQYGGGPFSAACATVFATGSAKGDDVVYTYTPSANGPFTLTLTPAGAYDAVLWVTTGTCGGGGGACVAAADAAGAGGAETLTIEGLAFKKYYIIVDGVAQGAAGEFTLIVQ